MNIQQVSVDKLKAAAYNPRKQLKPGDAEYEKLKRSITEFGYCLLYTSLHRRIPKMHQYSHRQNSSQSHADGY